jgi:hypothetical protein
MMQLTEPQKELLLTIGKPSSPLEVLTGEKYRNVTKELVQLELLEKSGEGNHYRITSTGQRAYDELTGKKR